MAIPLKIWQAAREDYISGGGSLRAMAEKHGLGLPTVEKRARREGWHRLRSERDEALRTGATPPAFPPPYAPPAPTSEPLSADWLQEKRRNHFLETQSLIEATRAKLRKKLEGDGQDRDELTRIASTLHTLVDAEARVLGIRDARKDKPRRGHGYAVPLVEPIGPEVAPIREPLISSHAPSSS